MLLYVYVYCITADFVANQQQFIEEDKNESQYYFWVFRANILCGIFNEPL